MIKTFEQFISTIYGRPVNEAFQSSKLRDLVKKHGKPKYRWECNMFYDLKDENIVDVLPNMSEYYDKYLKDIDKKSGEQATFKINLGDGTIVVISNLDIFNSYFDRYEMEKKKNELFKKKRDARHVGNQGRGHDTINDKFEEKKTAILKRRCIERIQPYFSVRIVGLNLPNGWDNVPAVKSGIPLLRKSCKRLP